MSCYTNFNYLDTMLIISLIPIILSLQNLGMLFDPIFAVKVHHVYLTMFYLWLAMAFSIESYYSIRDSFKETNSAHLRSCILKILDPNTLQQPKHNSNSNKIKDEFIKQKQGMRFLATVENLFQNEEMTNFNHSIHEMDILNDSSSHHKEKEDHQPEGPLHGRHINTTLQLDERFGLHDPFVFRMFFQQWKKLSDFEFFVFMLLTLKTIDYRRDIRPLQEVPQFFILFLIRYIYKLINY